MKIHNRAICILSLSVLAFASGGCLVNKTDSGLQPHWADGDAAINNSDEAKLAGVTFGGKGSASNALDIPMCTVIMDSTGIVALPALAAYSGHPDPLGRFGISWSNPGHPSVSKVDIKNYHNTLQYFDANANGQKDDDQKDRREPLCYMRSGTTRYGDVTQVLTAYIWVKDSLFTDKSKVRVTAKTTGNTSNPGSDFTVDATSIDFVTAPGGVTWKLPSGGKILQVTVTSPALPSVIGANMLQVKFRVSPNEGTDWYDAGGTSNIVYDVLERPDSSTPLYQTVLDVSCLAAAGKSSKADAETEIWNKFASRNIVRADGQPMHYWGQISGYVTDESDDYFTIPGLIYFADGRCASWSLFYKATMEAQGVHVNGLAIYGIVGASTTTYIFVKPDAPAQNMSSPWYQFGDHAVNVHTNYPTGSTTIYDPNYGIKQNNIVDYQNAAILKVKHRVSGTEVNTPQGSSILNVIPHTGY